MKMYIPVPTKFISSFTEALPFDVYVERSEGIYTAIYKKNSSHDEKQLARYEEKNIKNLFISRNDKLEFENFLINLNDLEHYEKTHIIEILKASLELNFEYLDFASQELQTNLELATQNVKNSLYLLENDLQMAMDIFKSLASSSHLLKHSYMVSLFSIVLAKRLGMKTERVILAIGLGGLLHDIGQTRMDQALFLKNNLSAKDWEEIKDHPQLGLKILDHNNCINTEVRSIIIQHHEQFNGRGYPNRLHNNQIFPPAKIVAIADGFCSLISLTSYRKTNKTPKEAIEIMRDDLGHYDPDYLEIFAAMVLQSKELK
ncbi:MAG: HD domain-containing protein [Bacteriovorax sp.]|nr:HD domain-containing protein [Bacteriovorax sp.]